MPQKSLHCEFFSKLNSLFSELHNQGKIVLKPEKHKSSVKHIKRALDTAFILTYNR